MIETGFEVEAQPIVKVMRTARAALPTEAADIVFIAPMKQIRRRRR